MQINTKKFEEINIRQESAKKLSELQNDCRLSHMDKEIGYYKVTLDMMNKLVTLGVMNKDEIVKLNKTICRGCCISVGKYMSPISDKCQGCNVKSSNIFSQDSRISECKKCRRKICKKCRSKGVY